MKSLTGFIEFLEKNHPKDVLHVDVPINQSKHEISAYLKILEEKDKAQVVLFDNVKNLKGEKSHFPLAYNLFATRSLCALAIDEPPTNDQMGLGIRFGEIQKKPGSTIIVDTKEAPIMQNILTGKDADVSILPAARYHEKDAGDYFVMACLMKSREGNFYDVTPTKNMVHGPNRLSISAHGHHHLARIIGEYEKVNEPAPVAIILGNHPAFYLGSCAMTPYGNNDYETISGFLKEPIRLTPSATFGRDFLVPADAEIIIEGIVLPGVRECQNPFGEISGHYQNRMEYPVVEVKAICYRNNAVMEGIFPAHAEHIILGGLPKEGSVFNEIKRVVPDVTAVHLSHSGMGRFSAYISLQKRDFRDVSVAGMIAFAECPNLKLAVVVDSTINVFAESEVMWAVSTQARWDKDLTVIPKVQSFRAWLGDAVCIIDATRHEEVPDYPERNIIPEAVVKMIRSQYFK